MQSADLSVISGRDFGPELVFAFSRSSGPGGQNVNKVSTKVELRFIVRESALLSDEEKTLLVSKLASRINRKGELHLVSQSERSQLKNKEVVIEKFYALLARALAPKKKRKRSRPSAASKEKRLETKRMTAQKKEQRSRINP